MVIKSNTFQQRDLENNYLETDIQKDNYFGPAPCQPCMSCQSKSAGSRPAASQSESQPASKPTSKLQASKPAASKPAAVKGGRRLGRSLKIKGRRHREESKGKKAKRGVDIFLKLTEWSMNQSLSYSREVDKVSSLVALAFALA